MLILNVRPSESMKKVEPQDIYRTHMIDVKLRIVSAFRISDSSHTTLDLSAFDIEYCFLQIRRIIESITFAAMVREESRYRRAREMKNINNPRKHGNVSKDWNASDILKTLIGLSPHILPIPTKEPLLQEQGLWYFERKQMTVNHDRLIEMYKRASGFLHAKNPFLNNFVTLIENERIKYGEAPRLIKKDLDFLWSLVWKHAAVSLEWTDHNNPQIADDPKSVWMVDFGAEEDQKIYMTVGEAV